MHYRLELREQALYALTECETEAKLTQVERLMEDWSLRRLDLNVDANLHCSDSIPGLPQKPVLVPPTSVKKRGMQTLEGRATLIHALTHIEFMAVNLALDAIWRFSGLPESYYTDWLKVASEEATHFKLLNAHLRTLGYTYGDFPAHNSLWEMAEKTKDDVLARMALVPRTLEARGLDVTPAMRTKLLQAGDSRAAEILEIILRDEIGHVAIGNHWYAYLCVQRGVEPIKTYRDLLRIHRAPILRGPLNQEARRAAGFSKRELEELSVS